MITPDQITITSDLVYEGCGLPAMYAVNGAPRSAFLSDEQIMQGLVKVGRIQSFSVQQRSITTQRGHFYRFDEYMRLNLDKEMAAILLANHENNRTDKPIAK